MKKTADTRIEEADRRDRSRMDTRHRRHAKNIPRRPRMQSTNVMLHIDHPWNYSEIRAEWTV